MLYTLGVCARRTACDCRVLRADRDEANPSGAAEHARQERSHAHHRAGRVRPGGPDDRTEHIASESTVYRRQSVARCARLLMHCRHLLASVLSTVIAMTVSITLT